MFDQPEESCHVIRMLIPALLLLLSGCQDAANGPTATVEPAAQSSSPAAIELPTRSFDDFSREVIEQLLALDPEWAVYQGRYENAHRLTVPDVEYRQRRVDTIDELLGRLADYEPDRLTPEQRSDYALLENRLAAMRWYQTEFRAWQWAPSSYNVAGVINLLLNTEFAPLDERLRLISERLDRVPAYYDAARANLERPTLQHTELAITQNRGGLNSLGEPFLARVEQSGLDQSERQLLIDRLERARTAINQWLAELEDLQARLAGDGEARSFRIGETLYEQKFAYDIQADFTARQLYERALDEKQRVLADMDEMAQMLWPRYFPDLAVPEERLERIGSLIDHLSARHTTLEAFIPEIRRQIPALAEFAREKRLLDQDPDKPLVVRETPEYMRGGGAIASVSAPGPFNPGADTFYNVTPLESYGEELAASYLREYNDWILQILNIHEAIPGHYTQLLHANRSPSLVKSLFGNGAMIEGWAVYAERMMLEAGWGDNEPELWLMYGKWALRVIHNAIIDYAVHVEGMDQEEVLDLLQNEAFQEVSEASQKWRRVTLSQVQLTSYFSGYAEIYDFRERLKVEQGDAFDLEAFHNEFLSYGSAPVAVIVELMSDQD